MPFTFNFGARRHAERKQYKTFEDSNGGFRQAIGHGYEYRGFAGNAKRRKPYYIGVSQNTPADILQSLFFWCKPVPRTGDAFNHQYCFFRGVPEQRCFWFFAKSTFQASRSMTIKSSNFGLLFGFALVVGLCVATAFISVSSVSGFLPAGTYFYIPACVFSICSLITVLVIWRSLPDADLGVVFLACAVPVLFLISFGLITWHQLPTRWLDFGMFQRGDAWDFLSSAVTLLRDGAFITPRGRVFSNVLYAGMLDVFAFDLTNIGWVITALAALAISAAILSASRLLGVIGSAITAYVLFDFAHEHIGGISTEMPGFIFGALSLPFLYRAVQARSHAAFIAGFALITSAMLVRIGAVLVLPALLLWAVVHLRGKLHRRVASTLVALSLAAGLFAGNSALTNHVSPESGGSFVNAVPSWYATIVEGQLLLGERDEDSVMPETRWVQIVEDHPEILEAPVSERPALQMRIFLGTLTAHPAAAVTGGVLEVVRYLGLIRMYNFIELKPLRVLLALFAIIGIAHALAGMWRGRSSTHDFFGLMALALIFSQPFLYGGETRTPAPTVAFLAGLSTFGLLATLGHFGKLPQAIALPQVRGDEAGQLLWFGSYTISVISLSAISVVFMAGLAALGTYNQREAALPECASRQARSLILLPGTALDTRRSPAAFAFISEFSSVKYPFRSMSRSIRPTTYFHWEKVSDELSDSGFAGYAIDVDTGTLRGPVFADRPTKGERMVICATAGPYGLVQTR